MSLDKYMTIVLFAFGCIMVLENAAARRRDDQTMRLLTLILASQFWTAAMVILGLKADSW